MERPVRHLLILITIVVCVTTDLPRLVARFFTNDFHIADLYYTIRGNEDPFEEEVVLVNVSTLSRAELGKQIFTLAQYQPKVIGMDLIFRGEKDPEGNALLQYVLMNTPNMVLIGERATKEDNSGDSLVLSHPLFAPHTYHGIGENIIDVNVGRRLQKKYYFANGDSAYHFAVQMAMLYDSARAEAFLNRPDSIENIYFLGNIPSYEDNPKPSKFFVLDVQDVMEENFTPDLIKDKIVLMGFLGEYAGDPYLIEDKFYSPLRAFAPVNMPPDMFGAVVHANALSMILRGNFVDQLLPKEEALLALALGLLNTLIFLAILYGRKTHKWYAVLSSLVILAELFAYPQIGLYLFDKHRYLLDLTYTPFVVLLSSYGVKVYLHAFLRTVWPWWAMHTQK